jgi:predicted TIM-barrel fold metal-dependent hydrolase
LKGFALLIADAQVHIWGADTPARPWPKSVFVPHRPEPMSRDELLREMDAAGVTRAVIVPPAWEGDRNDLALEAARLYPQRLAVMGRLDLAAPAARTAIAGWRGGGMLGLRTTFNFPAVQAPLTERRLDWFWQAAAAAQLPLMIYVPLALMPLIDEVATRHPQLKLVLDHMGLVGKTRGDAAFDELDQLLALARHPNVAVKPTTAPLYATDDWPYRSVHPYLRRVFDAFGPRRFFWGSDFTQILCSYADSVRMYMEELPWLNDADKEWVMGRGVCEWLGWPWPQ